MLPEIVILIVLFLLSFLFSGLETGIVSLDMLRLEKDAKGHKGKRELLNTLMMSVAKKRSDTIEK